MLVQDVNLDCEKLVERKLQECEERGDQCLVRDGPKYENEEHTSGEYYIIQWPTFALALSLVPSIVSSSYYISLYIPISSLPSSHFFLYQNPLFIV